MNKRDDVRLRRGWAHRPRRRDSNARVAADKAAATPVLCVPCGGQP